MLIHNVKYVLISLAFIALACSQSFAQYENGTCMDAPICGFTVNGPIKVAVGEEIDFEFYGVAVCDGHSTRIAMPSRPPFIIPASHRNGGPNETLSLSVKGTPGPGDVGVWRLRMIARDVNNGIESECEIWIKVTGTEQCIELPVCTITPQNNIIALPGESITIGVCGASQCDDGSVMIGLSEAPDFCDPFGSVVGAMNEQACAELFCTVPDDVEPGNYPVRFRITDQENGRFVFCQTTIVIEEPPALSFCVEEEPNNDITNCTILDTNECLDLGCGSNIVGMLDLEGVDLDYYCLTGLEPFTEYLVTVVGGVDCNGAPVCAALACLDENGGIINSTNSGGLMTGYPSINCVSDFNGLIHVAVSGCDDLDFDGQADNPGVERGGIGHGSTGSYQLVASVFNLTPASLSCNADMNNDGVIDSADLGMLLGVFGDVCAP